jgi:hypothetical protein
MAIYLFESYSNRIYHNNFINNAAQVYTWTRYESLNVWDDSGKGNYWSDYKEKYPDAEEIDGSGIWDTPYVIDEKNQDKYPIVTEFPSFLILPLFMIATLLTVATMTSKRNELNLVQESFKLPFRFSSNHAERHEKVVQLTKILRIKSSSKPDPAL